jgi:signal transduction histidine kinase
LSGADVRVLQSLAGPLASAAYALRLSGDLEESRRRLLTAREDERRRLRRDLHDGLGPQLAGVVMGLDVIQSSLSRGNADTATELAATVGGQARTAVEDVRRLVAGLRPPVLDDLGLLGALQASGIASGSSPAAGSGAGGPAVRFAATGDLDGLPAAVEVAAYRIVSEALTNAARHSGADEVLVTLRRSESMVRVEVEDDGTGMPAEIVPGVGLQSMRERAAELGGWCTVTGSPRGTRVVAELPLEVP